MPTDCISYQNSGYFSPLMNDYLNQKINLQSLYNRFPTLDNFETQILEKQANFNNDNRAVLVSVLQNQYSKIAASDLTKKNIKFKYIYGNNWTSAQFVQRAFILFI
jgi:hypothetical protein